MRDTDEIIRPTRNRMGFTLIEAVMSILVVGLMLVAALNTLGALKISQCRNAEQSVGPMLAEQLMAEILDQAYEDPDDTPLFGREGESATSRANWDDVDDYDGWTGTSPTLKEGTAIDCAAGFQRTVSVTWATPAAPDTASLLATNLKRIDVTVTRNGREVASLSALRGNAWDEMTAMNHDQQDASETELDGLLGDVESAASKLLDSLLK